VVTDKGNLEFVMRNWMQRTARKTPRHVAESKRRSEVEAHGDGHLCVRDRIAVAMVTFPRHGLSRSRRADYCSETAAPSRRAQCALANNGSPIWIGFLVMVVFWDRTQTPLGPPPSDGLSSVDRL
jgi:hypothetical protein